MAKKKQDPIQKIITATQAYNCLDCGKCSAVCPISLLNNECLPRLTVTKALIESPEVLMEDELLWSCLNCGLCYERCELEVKFHEFVRDLRVEARKIGREGIYAHGGTLHSWMTMMTDPDLKQKRLDWVTEDLKIKEEGDVIYLVEDLPYYDRFFTDLNVQPLDIARSTIKILNHLGIEPVLMPNERCCGHDLLWTGDVDTFKKLAELNTEAIKATGAKTIITACPEVYHTLSVEYPKYVGKLGAKVVHLSQFLANRLSDLDLAPLKKRVTYQDPCRLGRFCGIYEEPRTIISAIEGVELCEMNRNRKSAICCGTSGWLNCGTCNKQIQTDRLTEAKNTGADMLITACPKCAIHFACALHDEDVPAAARIEIKDLTVLVAEQLKDTSST